MKGATENDATTQGAFDGEEGVLMFENGGVRRRIRMDSVVNLGQLAHSPLKGYGLLQI